MLSKFISVSETHFQNTETALKNQQALIQGLGTQIGQLSKLISERPQGSLQSNTEPSPREQLNAINIQDDEGVVEPEPKLRQETVVSKGQGEMPSAMKFLKELLANKQKLDEASHVELNVVCSAILQNKEMSLKEVHEPFSSNSRGPIHEDRRLQIEELDEWRTHKPRTPDKLNLRRNELNFFPNQLKVGDRVLLDAVNPHIVATTQNEEIPLTVLIIFHSVRSRFRMLSSRGKKAVVPASKKRKGASSSLGPTAEVRHPFELFFGIIELTYLEITMELCSTFHLQTVMTNYDDPGTVQFRLGGLVWQLSVPKFSTVMGLYTEEFKEENDLHALNRHIHRSLLQCWDALVPGTATYNPCRSKASALPPCLRKRVISIGPYVTQLAQHFALLSTVAQESSLTLIGQMSPQGISSMLSMRMIEKHQGTYPPQYHLTQSTKEEAYEDIPDDVLPQHEDPLTQPPPPSCPVHVAASYADISERLTRFEQQCFQ
ncbi:hypothetical protein GOBAR_AA03644 [Gossypium barbadense]|uniref:Uncharacterized protein n=1 Tax=Gossypium barbadense TaxID=3634 RepID=A0A2P5YMZ3_GOSBA|nr:hypothetical protein GOBAR_AA03644 [Gossypium barbadense]